MTIYTPTWLSKLQDFFAVPLSWCKPVASIQWGWGSRRWPNPLNLRVKIWDENPSLYMNGILFASIRLPFFVNIMVRWANDTVSPAFVQTHIGWRPVDGRPVIVLRFQSDQSAQGGLAVGYEDGGK